MFSHFPLTYESIFPNPLMDTQFTLKELDVIHKRPFKKYLPPKEALEEFPVDHLKNIEE